MNDENEEQKKGTTKENLEAVGQFIVGEVETIGGILTADPITQAEGDYNVETGNLRREVVQDLNESDKTGTSQNSDRHK